MYLYAGRRLQTGQEYGRELATGASALLLLSAAPRFAAGPVPKLLTTLGAVGGLYYGNQIYRYNVGY